MMTLYTGTHLVVLDVVVTNKKGHTVPGLPEDDFKIFEDGQPQRVEFFEEHDPVDPELVAREKAELAARLPPNTFTSYEPLTGNPVTILLLNKLTSLPGYDIEPLRQQMLQVISGAPRDTPFAIYQLDSKLRLVQPVTTNRNLLVIAVNQMWQKPIFGVRPAALGLGKSRKSKRDRKAAVVLARRKVLTGAMQQLDASFGPAMGRKSIFAFTGGLRCTLSSAPDCASVSPELKPYLCSIVDVLEQARISIYRYYPDGQTIHGFACSDWNGTLNNVFDTNAHYYTFYYTPTNEDWDGKFRKFKVTIAENNLHLSYRAGYYGREENAEAVRDDRAAETAQPDLDEDATAPVVSTTPALAAPAGLAETAPEDSLNPMPIVFKVTVDPAAAPGRQDASPSPGNAESKAERRQGDRGYTLHFFVAAAGLRLVHEPPSEQIPGQGAYSTRLEITAVSYMNGHLANENSIQVSAAFDGPADPRIAKGAITASLKVQVPKKGKRLIRVTVRDVFSGQFARLDIPVEKIALP